MDNFVRFKDAVNFTPPEIPQKVKDYYTEAVKQGLQDIRPLRIKIAATHAGKVTRNNGFYLPHKMQKGADTFISQYPKPIQIHHADHKDPVGRVIDAKYVDMSVFVRDSLKDSMTDEQTKLIEDFTLGNTSFDKIVDFANEWIINDLKISTNPDYEGLGYIELTASITDPDAIQKLLDGRYLTGSVGATTNQAVCSTCKQDWASDGKCVLPNTEILLADGTTKPIQEIQPEDLVVTHTGSIGKVTKLLQRHYNDEIIIVDRIGTNQPLGLTKGHPVYHGLVHTERHRINKTDRRKRVKVLLEQGWIDSDNLVENKGYLSIPLIKTPSKATKLNCQEMSLLGLYAAEGSNTNGNCIEFSIHQDEVEAFDHYFSDIHRDYFVYVRDNNLSVSCRFSDQEWKRLCNKHVGHGAATKKLSENIVFAEDEKVKYFLGAYIDGDGCLTKDQFKIKMHTASKAMAHQILTMCHRIGVYPNFYKWKNSGGPTNRDKECIIYEIQISRSQASVFVPYSVKMRQYVDTDKKCEHKIQLDDKVFFKYQADTGHYHGTVYNLEVESPDDAHSYIANDIAVHNCEHKPGKVYDGVKCVIVAGDLFYDEYSFVNKPADRHSRVIEININGIQDFVTIDEEDLEISLVLDKNKQEDIVIQDKDSTEQDNTDPVATFFGDEYEDIVGEDDWGREYAEMLYGLVEDVSSPEEKEKMTTLVYDAKLSSKKRKSLPDSAFCAPDRAFPVNDCPHYTAALRLIGKYKGPGDKNRIRACIERKGKRLGCGSNKKDSIIMKEFTVKEFDRYDDEELVKMFDALQEALKERKIECGCEQAKEIEKAVQEAKKQSDTDLQDENEQLNKRLENMRKETRYLHGDIENLTNQVADKTSELRDEKVHRVIDMRRLTGEECDFQAVSDELKEKSSKELDEIIKDIAGKVDTQKIADTLNSGLSNNPSGTVEDPTLEQDNRKKEKEKVQVNDAVKESLRLDWLRIRTSQGQEAADNWLSDVCKTNNIDLDRVPAKEQS